MSVLRKFFRRDSQDRDRDAEIQAHVDLAVEHYIEQGMSRDDARRTSP
jgi:hypothetical protein